MTLHPSLTDETRRMIGLRREVYSCIFAEETRANDPEVAMRGPGITPGPAIQMGNFNVASPDAEDDVGAWYAQYRLPFMAAMPGCIGARKLLATAGWGKHSILYEFVSLEAREQYFIPHEEEAHKPESWTARDTMVVSTVCRSSVELMARLTSLSAVRCSTDRVSAAVRASSSLNNRTFSIAITA